jgi:predicted lipoprotein with Yx(FWY)xxD motif
MRIIVSALALSALAGAAFAGQAPSAAEAGKDALSQGKSPRTVYVCDDDAMTRRAFAREHGQVEFVTAKQAQAKGEAWAQPKCITSAEARRLQKQKLASR